MEDHQSPSKEVSQDDLNLTSRVREHLKRYIKHRKFQVEMINLQTEYASYMAQLKILDLLKKKGVKHAFRLKNNSFDLNVEVIKENALNSIAQPINDMLKKEIEQCSSKTQYSDTLVYAAFQADTNLENLWKQRIKQKNKAKDKIKEKKSKSIRIQESQLQQICAENKLLTDENEELRKKIKSLEDQNRTINSASENLIQEFDLLSFPEENPINLGYQGRDPDNFLELSFENGMYSQT